MATLTPTSMQGSGSRTVTENTLTASDTFTYLRGTGQMLLIRNNTAGSITVTIDGADGVATAFPGIPSVPIQNGIALAAMGVGVVRIVELDKVWPYLQGVIAMTGGSGATAILLNN